MLNVNSVIKIKQNKSNALTDLYASLQVMLLLVVHVYLGVLSAKNAHLTDVYNAMITTKL